MFFFSNREKTLFFKNREKGKIRKTNGAFQFRKTPKIRKIPIFQKNMMSIMKLFQTPVRISLETLVKHYSNILFFFQPWCALYKTLEYGTVTDLHGLTDLRKANHQFYF